jgi:hypothetical protein
MSTYIHYTKKSVKENLKKVSKRLMEHTRYLNQLLEDEIEYQPISFPDMEQCVGTIRDLYVQLLTLREIETSFRKEDEFYDARVFYNDMTIRSQNQYAPEWEELTQEQKLAYKKKETESRGKK